MVKDINDLIKSILSQDKITNQFDESKVYSDEPILFTASQMKNYTPPIYHEMRSLAHMASSVYSSAAEIFYRQAKLMEWHEDNYDFRGEFFTYFPTYQSMNKSQLRGYFSWRTKVRQGEIRAVSLSFACVYLYELINQIGVSSAQDGYWKIKNFCDAYVQKDRRLVPYATGWLRDYVVYYGLDKSFLDNSPGFDSDNTVLTVLNFEQHSAQELTEALSVLSTYKLTESKFYFQYPEDVAAVTYDVCKRLELYCAENKRISFFKTLLGSRLSFDRTMFTSAVFYEQKRHPNCVYEVNALHRYVCKNGRWTYEQCYGCIYKNRKITQLLKMIECVMRQEYKFKYKLKPCDIPPEYLSIIEESVAALIEEKRKAAIPKIEINTSLLQSIRDNSSVTQSKLLTEDDLREAEEQEKITEAVNKDESSGVSQESITTPLNETESELLRLVLLEEDSSLFLREKKLMLSVIVDEINEKLFDMFEDSVLVCDGHTAQPVEDYTEELKGLIGL